MRDAVQAYDYILRSGAEGTVYRIDSGTQRTLGDISVKLLAHAKAPVPMDWGPDAPGQAPEPAGGAGADTLDEAVENAATLGWKPEISLERSLKEIVDYCRSGREGRLS
ncbi:GDP-6-deoxy-D-mannose reductase [compost metagenome]